MTDIRKIIKRLTIIVLWRLDFVLFSAVDGPTCIQYQNQYRFLGLFCWLWTNNTSLQIILKYADDHQFFLVYLVFELLGCERKQRTDQVVQGHACVNLKSIVHKYILERTDFLINFMIFFINIGFISLILVLDSNKQKNSRFTSKESNTIREKKRECVYIL